MSDLISENVCKNCGGRVDRPGLYRCVLPCHPTPTLAQRVVAGIERDMDDRRHLGLDGIDADLRVEIRDRWAAIVEEELARPHAGP